MQRHVQRDKNQFRSRKTTAIRPSEPTPPIFAVGLHNEFFFDGTRYFWLQCDYFVPPFRHSTNHCELLKNASPCIKIYHVRQKFKTFPERGTGPSQTITYVAMGSLLPISHSSVLTAPRSSRLPCSGHPSFKLVPIPCDTGISEQKVQISNGDITFAASRRNIIVAIIDVRPMSYLHTRNVRIS